MSHPIISFIPIFSIFWQENTQRLVVNSAHRTKILSTTHLGTGSIFVFTEKILWIISLILKISSLLPPGSFGGPDADLKLDIMKLNSHIIFTKCIIFVFSDTSKIYDKKSALALADTVSFKKNWMNNQDFKKMNFFLMNILDFKKINVCFE